MQSFANELRIHTICIFNDITKFTIDTAQTILVCWTILHFWWNQEMRPPMVNKQENFTHINLSMQKSRRSLYTHICCIRESDSLIPKHLPWHVALHSNQRGSFGNHLSYVPVLESEIQEQRHTQEDRLYLIQIRSWENQINVGTGGNIRAVVSNQYKFHLGWKLPLSGKGVPEAETATTWDQITCHPACCFQNNKYTLSTMNSVAQLFYCELFPSDNQSIS